MTLPHRLKAGDTLTNAELTAMFKCANQGGMRRSHQTNSLVIISDHTKYVHRDRWISADVLYYTGMGLEGDQSLDYLQNKTLLESAANGVTPYLFEVYVSNQYLFRGRVKLAARPRKERQPDICGKLRDVWIFPLQVTGSDAAFTVPEELIDRKRLREKKRAQQMSATDLLTVTVHAEKQTPSTPATVSDQGCDAYVAEFSRRRANGHCQLCGLPAPFTDKANEPYLELHHIHSLARGGRDMVSNCVALCPNCHKKMHVLNLREDRKRLRQEARKNCCQLTIDGGIVYV